MSSERDKTDGELVVRAIDGDEKAFREILSRYRQKVLAICLRMLKNRVFSKKQKRQSLP